MAEMTTLTPEHISRWVAQLPFIGRIVRRRVYRRILLSRTEEKVASEWSRAGIQLDTVMPISILVAEECSWPNPFFIPDDWCSAVFFESEMDMSAAIAFVKISDMYPQSNLVECSDHLDRLMYIDFICAVLHGKDAKQ